MLKVSFFKNMGKPLQWKTLDVLRLGAGSLGDCAGEILWDRDVMGLNMFDGRYCIVYLSNTLL